MGDADYHDGPPFFPRKSSSYDLNSKIMLAAIVSLTAVVIIVIALHIYVRCALRRRRSGFLARIRSMGYPPPRTGLDPMLIASLPAFAFKQTAAPPPTECSVCLSSFEEDEMVRLLPNCKHIFHAECIDMWLDSHSTCPICRAEVEPRLQPEPREGPAGTLPIAPPPERMESSDGQLSAAKLGAGSSSSSRLSSFRRMLSRERSSRRLQSEDFCSSLPSPSDDNTDTPDLERQ